MSQGLLSDAFLISLIAGAVAAGLPLLLAGLGEQVSEKAGVLNIGIEGMMLFGAYAGFATALWHEFALARLPRGRGGGPRDGDADGALLRPPWAQPDRDRDRPHPRRGRDHRPPPPRAVQPHLSAIATGRDPGHSRAERDPDHRAQPLLPAPDGLHRGHSGRGARPAFPQYQRGAQPPGRRRQARRARRGRDQRGPRRAHGRCSSPAPWRGSAAPTWRWSGPESSCPS